VTSNPTNPAAKGPPGAGYDNLVATLLSAQLPLPPVPVPFQADLRCHHSWVWSTRPISPMDMYMFDRYVDEAGTGPVDDYVAVSHAGHGVNSYGLNYHLVYGPLALFTQNGWGGGYADPAKERESIAATFRLAADLVASCERHRSAGRPTPRVRLVVAFSDFRNVSWWRLRSMEPVSESRHARRRADAGQLSLGTLFAEASTALCQLLTPT
jgi:hypothetical protein